MRSFVRNLSARGELCLVLCIAFGLQTVAATIAIVSQWRHGPPLQIQLGPGRVLRTVIPELICLAAILWIGRVRGWSFSNFRLRVSWKGTGAGFLLYLFVLLVEIVFGFTVLKFHLPRTPRILGVTLPSAILISAVNPVFEEFIESGYLLTALHRLGMWPAVLATAVFVGLLHSYQGPVGVTFNLVFRVILGLTYWRWRQLWPLIVAHALQDFVALAASLAR